MVITACVIQSKNEFFCVLNFKGFHLTKRKGRKYKGGDKHELWIEKEDKLIISMFCAIQTC